MDTYSSGGLPDPNSFYLQKFVLYETYSNFYMIGRDKSRAYWRVLKIDRLDPSELNILEDYTTYSEIECRELLKRIDEGNKSTGGLNKVTTCYGIVGFVKFLGPYYMLIITERKKIGAICGHAIYAITKSEMIPIPNSSVRSNMTNSKNENRYKKLLCTVDLSRDFFFSYSYHVMHCLQKNISNNETGKVHYESMFVWNEFLTREIRNNLKHTIWTVALVYGFFKQVKLSVSGRDFKLTLIARRSRHYAGTRYLKRGVNKKGRVANDVETEQIVFEDIADGYPVQISSAVQHRGSIPLFWSQETSRLNIKPDIILSKEDQNYEATKLHFENLVKRYGNPIIILNLIKTHEKKPRESILRTEFANAIKCINKGLSEENRLRFLHWDLHRATNVLLLLSKVAEYAVNLTGIFYCQVTPSLRPTERSSLSYSERSDGGNEFGRTSAPEIGKNNSGACGNLSFKVPMFQRGVLRTNCIDCLDRTNVAQYAYGLVALGHQLHALGLMESTIIDLHNPLAEDLMKNYEIMGDTLALQYGGSAAHNKIFSERRGQWKAATHSQEFFRTLQRYYSNAYMDAEKQHAINVFLGHFQPQQGKPALWELGSDQHHNVRARGLDVVDEGTRSSFIRRSLSDGDLLCECDSLFLTASGGQNKLFPGEQGFNNGLSDSTPEISTCESDISHSRYTPTMPRRRLFKEIEEEEFDNDRICYDEHGETCNCSNFLDLEWLSSSGNSFDEDHFDRSIAGLSSEYLVNEMRSDTPASESGSCLKGSDQTAMGLSSNNLVDEFSKHFADWVRHGETLCPL
ncbi:phosphoinositide phosphatase SAC2-like isoform X2 [Mercurialis annua]|uniref:phosphoinositide phosphatase SAC2-like isoform X2 n=1 Tax=Mercurialis annua TaxID=3986 RepID=UPI0021607B2E|nr:phosphoinositide phosphatase SAC2-like isoform X2 [Mercurialis annua]